MSVKIVPDDGSWLANYYPDVLAAGGLATAIVAGMKTKDSIEILRDGLTGWATLRNGNRSVQVACAIQKRLFIVSFIQGGVFFAKLGPDDLAELSRATETWLVETVNLEEFKSLFPSLEVLPQGLAVELGRELEYQWEFLQTSSPPWFRVLVEAASAHPKLRKLFPFRSMVNLRFSRTMGWPYTWDYPFLRIRNPAAAHYQVVQGPPDMPFPESLTGGVVLFEGSDVAEAVEALAEALPAPRT